MVEGWHLFKVLFRTLWFPTLQFFGLANLCCVSPIEELNCLFRFGTTLPRFLFALGVWIFIVVLLIIYIHQILVWRWRFWCLISLLCGELQTLLQFIPLVGSLGDNLVVLPTSLEGAMVHPFAWFSSCGFLTGCLHCSLAATIMDPDQRMVSRRGGITNVWVKRSLCFSFDTIKNFFDFVPREVLK